MKRWVFGRSEIIDRHMSVDILLELLLEIRGIRSAGEISGFLHPGNPHDLTAKDLGIDEKELGIAVERIKTALKNNESLVVYADYDADGVTAGALMWEQLNKLRARVMPYIPHRIEEGYGLSVKGLDTVKKDFNPSLIITVDHGITGWEKVEYAKSLGMDVIVTDHHTKPEKLPRTTTVHTTSTSGAGISWFLASRLDDGNTDELLALASIGIIADLIPLIGINRLFVRKGLEVIRKTERVGLKALIADAGITQESIGTYEISHMIAPRLNAMGRLDHALDALRLLCTGQEDKAMILARKLGLTNRERQKMTEDMTLHAMEFYKGDTRQKEGTNAQKLIFISHHSYNPGVIGLVAGKLVEEFYLPAVVLAVGPEVSKASARSIAGFNIVEAIRSCSDLLIDVGGHPMAAGFTVETSRIGELKERMEAIAAETITEETLLRKLSVDLELPIAMATEELWQAIRQFEPFGLGNMQPVFASRGLEVLDAKLVGANAKHLKLKLGAGRTVLDAIGFGMGDVYPALRPDSPIDVAYNLDVNTWNGRSSVQLKLKDIIHTS